MQLRKFEHLLKQTNEWDETRQQVPRLDFLMPSIEFMADFVVERADDIEKINALLLDAVKPQFSFEKPTRAFALPLPWEMDQFLLRIVFAMPEEMAQMRGQIAALQDTAGTA